MLTLVYPAAGANVHNYMAWVSKQGSDNNYKQSAKDGLQDMSSICRFQNFVVRSWLIHYKLQKVGIVGSTTNSTTRTRKLYRDFVRITGRDPWRLEPKAKYRWSRKKWLPLQLWIRPQAWNEDQGGISLLPWAARRSVPSIRDKLYQLWSLCLDFNGTVQDVCIQAPL